MRYQDQLVRMTQKALDDICRSALAVPADKADWSPGGDARSTLSQMREVATASKWFMPMICERVVPDFSEHARREAEKLRESFDTIEKCIEAAQNTTSELCQAILSFPDAALEDEMVLPFGGGMVLTLADVLAIHHWNLIYHLGQINQIQLTLGDKEMH